MNDRIIQAEHEDNFLLNCSISYKILPYSIVTLNSVTCLSCVCAMELKKINRFSDIVISDIVEAFVLLAKPMLMTQTSVCIFRWILFGFNLRWTPRILHSVRSQMFCCGLVPAKFTHFHQGYIISTGQFIQLNIDKSTQMWRIAIMQFVSIVIAFQLVHHNG